MNPIQFQITQLRAKNQQTLLEMIGINVFSMFFGAFAPSLIISVFFSNQQLLEAPWFYQAIPVASLGLAILYTLYALLTNLLREAVIKNLSSKLVNISDAEVDLNENEIKELEKMVDKTIGSTKRNQIKKSSKKSTKKTTTK